MSQRTALRLSTILILIGGLLSGYLLYRHLGLLGAWEVGQDACATLLGTGCDRALHSQGSIQMEPGRGLVVVRFHRPPCLRKEPVRAIVAGRER